MTFEAMFSEALRRGHKQQKKVGNHCLKNFAVNRKDSVFFYPVCTFSFNFNCWSVFILNKILLSTLTKKQPQLTVYAKHFPQPSTQNPS